MEPSVRDFFLAQLARHFPEASAPYERVFGFPGGSAPNRYAPKAYAARIQLQIGELKERYGLGDRHEGTATTVSVAEDTDLPAAERTLANRAAYHARPPASGVQLALPL